MKSMSRKKAGSRRSLVAVTQAMGDANQQLAKFEGVMMESIKVHRSKNCLK